MNEHQQQGGFLALLAKNRVTCAPLDFVLSFSLHNFSHFRTFFGDDYVIIKKKEIGRTEGNLGNCEGKGKK